MKFHPDVLTVVPVPPPSEESRLENSFSAALLGGAIADAMGWITEFIKTKKELERKHSVDRIVDFVSWQKKTGGRFNPYIDYVGAGEYSDDTQLTLCVARSLTPEGTVDNEYFSKVELPAWLTYARGAGATITGAAKALAKRRASWNNNFFTFRRGGEEHDYRLSGANGAAMRIAPISMANWSNPSMITREVWRNAIVTHGHPMAIVGALTYAHALAKVIARVGDDIHNWLRSLESDIEEIHLPADDADLQTWYMRWNEGSRYSFDSLLSSSKTEMISAIRVVGSAAEKNPNDIDLSEIYARLGCLSSGTKGSAIASVGAALAVFAKNGRNFAYSVLDPVNMVGSDTDTIGAMAASLSGAHAGYSSIPEQWAVGMQDFSYFLRVAYALAKIAERRSGESELRWLPEAADDRISRIPSVLALANSSKIATGMRVRHDIFGIGTLRDVNEQELGSRRGGIMRFITVLFDSGQTCKFKFFRPREERPTESMKRQRRPKKASQEMLL